MDWTACTGAADGQQVARATTGKPDDPSAFLGAITESPSLFDQVGRIGGQLTPGTITSILQQADNGQITRFVDLFHNSRRKDGHLHSVCQTRELGLVSLEWDCVAMEDDPPATTEAAEALKYYLKRANPLEDDAVGFNGCAAHLNGEGNLFGFAYAETLWGMLDGLMVPTGWIPLSCRRFGFRTTDAKLLFNPKPNPLVNINSVGIDLLEEYPIGKFVRVLPRVNGDVRVREGLARLLVWAALFRNWGLRDWLQLAEMAWKPTRLGSYKSGNGGNKKDRADLRTVLERWTSDGVIVHPSDKTDVKIEWPKNQVGGQGSTHRELSEFLGGEMSKAVIGQTLTTESGSRGARSLGEVQNEVRHDIRDADAMTVAAAVQRFIVEPFVALNFGPNVPCPQFFYLTEDRVDMAAFSTAIEKLRTAGFRIPASYVSDQTGIPMPDDGEEVLGESDTDDDDEDDTETGSEGDDGEDVDPADEDDSDTD